MTTKEPVKTLDVQRIGPRELVVKKETVKHMAIKSSVRTGCRGSIIRTVYSDC